MSIIIVSFLVSLIVCAISVFLHLKFMMKKLEEFLIKEDEGFQNYLNCVKEIVNEALEKKL